MITNSNLGEIEVDDENNVITVVDAQINFWFDEEGVSEVQWSVNWDEDDNPIWPSQLNKNFMVQGEFDLSREITNTILLKTMR